MTKNRVGRPNAMTPEVIAKLENAFSMGCSDPEACLFAGINKATLYRYQQEHPEFSDRKDMLKRKLIMKARAVIAKELNDEDGNTAKWYLERKCRDEFATKVENDLNAKGLNIVVADEKAGKTIKDL